MLSESKILKNVHNVRAEMSTELEKLTPSERANKINSDAREIIKKYGLKVVFKD